MTENKPRVFWYYGGMASGKSHSAREFCQNVNRDTDYPKIDFKEDCLSRAVACDELDDRPPYEINEYIEHVAQLCGPSPEPTKIINGHRFKPEYVVVCSFVHPRERLNIDNPIHRQLLESIDEIYHCQRNGKTFKVNEE